MHPTQIGNLVLFKTLQREDPALTRLQKSNLLSGGPPALYTLQPPLLDHGIGWHGAFKSGTQDGRFGVIRSDR